MGHERETPDDFETMIALPAPPPRPGRGRVAAFWRDARCGVLGAALVVGIAAALLYGCAVLMFLPYELAHTTDTAKYPDLIPRMREFYGNRMDMFPASIPAGALEARLDANSRGMMQAKPYMELALRLDPPAAQAELVRLRSLHPRRESPSSFGPSRFHPSGPPTPSEAAILLEFAPERSSNQLLASVRHDPATGWFYYAISSD